jgi:hypothetical protein
MINNLKISQVKTLAGGEGRLRAGVKLNELFNSVCCTFKIPPRLSPFALNYVYTHGNLISDEIRFILHARDFGVRYVFANG